MQQLVIQTTRYHWDIDVNVSQVTQAMIVKMMKEYAKRIHAGKYSSNVSLILFTIIMLGIMEDVLKSILPYLMIVE